MLFFVVAFSLILSLGAVYHKLGDYDTPGHAYSVTVINMTAYVADWDGGLQIIDVSNPQNPVLLGSYNTPGEASSVSVVGTTAYVADYSLGLQIIDVTNPQNPVLLGSYDTPGRARSVFVVGTTAYVADGWSGLQIIDVTNPQNPVLLSSYNTPDNAKSVTVVGTTAYVADESTGLQIIDVTNPQSPVLLGSYNTPGNASSVAVINTTAYVADGSAGLQIIDVSNPQIPVLLESILPHATSYIYTCTVQGNRLYVSDYNWNEISIYDISIPQSPVLLHIYAWNLSTENMCINGNTLYTANGWYGLNIHELSAVDMTEDVVAAVPQPGLTIYPNPFRAETTLAVSLPRVERVKLSLYNLRGQLVRELSDGFRAQGQHSFTWDGKDDNGRDVSAGIYLIRFDNGRHKLLRKVIRF